MDLWTSVKLNNSLIAIARQAEAMFLLLVKKHMFCVPQRNNINHHVMELINTDLIYISQ